MSTSVSALSDDRLREFGTRFHGELVRPDSSDYDSARKVWNGMIDRRPACIARCRTTADVQAAIRFARDNALPIAIRGGGHNAAGLAVVGGGTTWGDFDRATAAHGLATTGGAISSTGIAGLTLGGGLGWLMRSYGMTA